MRKTIIASVSGLLLLTIAFAASAQMSETSYEFERRMESRIRSVEGNIKRLRKQVESEDESKDDRGSGSANMGEFGGVLYELEQMEDSLDTLERELQMMPSMMSPNDYETRRRRAQFEYYLDGMERRLRDIRTEMRWSSEEDARIDREQAEKAALEAEIEADRDWAEDWAGGKD